MNHSAVIESLSERLQRDKKDVNALLEGFVSAIQEYLCEMDSVQLPGFGTFSARKEEEKVVTDLSSGKKMLLPPAITLEFTQSAILKRKISD
ncbi:MAG: HU family DNA-binding protein [Muribaculum sp.]|nr:HU family DNA-binding protein [Muribaculum sp.]